MAAKKRDAYGANLQTLYRRCFIKNILIIEDDKALSGGIVLALQSEEFAMMQCFDLDSAREKT
ncbi:MAG: hypothetical protein RSE43_11000, partial [Oscillospiraceae bacterium]